MVEEVRASKEQLLILDLAQTHGNPEEGLIVLLVRADMPDTLPIR
jgi:hypothetical protein